MLLSQTFGCVEVPAMLALRVFGDRVTIVLTIACGIIWAAGCGGGSGSTPPPPPPPPTLATIVVSPQNPVIADNGATQALSATGHFDDGSTQDLTATVTWSSTNTAVATVSASGMVTSKTLGPGVSAGFTSIKAVSGPTAGVTILSVTNHTTNPADLRACSRSTTTSGAPARTLARRR